MDDMGLVDIWRIRNPNLLRFTRRQRTKKGYVHSRLDFFLVPVYLEYQIVDTDIKPSIYSDHSIVEINLEGASNISRGKGFWKFNSSLLTDRAYTHKVKECIRETMENNRELENKSLLWDLIKCKIRGMTVSYSSFKAKEQRQMETDLKKKLEELERNMHENNNRLLDYETTKREFEDIQKHKTRGIMIRSRAQFVEQGERNTKYFLNLEKHNHKVKNITCLLDDCETVITEPEKILQEQVRFYKTLYTETDTERHLRPENEYFLKNLPKISEKSKSYVMSK